MTELERSLRLLGDAVAFPEAPDVSEAVQRRLEGLRPERRGPHRRTLALAFAVVALAIGAAMAVPPARTAILEFLGLRGATVQRVDSLPTVTEPDSQAPGSQLLLGEPLPAADERLLVPAMLGTPDAAYAAEEDYGLRLTLVYGPGDGVPRSQYTGVGILVTEFDGAIDTRYLDKMVDADTSVEQLTVGGNRALWLEGGPHFVVFRTESGEIGEDVGRLAGNTLLVEHDGMLVRIEGQIDRARAIEIAESLEAA
jgi:hypothetical protein